jgi:serine O-acetyltransferase
MLVESLAIETRAKMASLSVPDLTRLQISHAMIHSKKDFLNYLEADRIALGRNDNRLLEKLISLISPDYIWSFQRLLRKLEFYKNVRNKGVINKVIYLYLRFKYKNLSVKLGFTIPENVFGPGLAIIHYGTIVVNHNAKVGANCRIHADTNIGASGGSNKAPQIGDNVYIAPGVKIIGDIKIPNNTAIGANSVVTKSFTEENMVIAGVPAKIIKPIAIRQIIKHI